MALRKTKRAETMVNIRPMIHALTAQMDEEKNAGGVDGRAFPSLKPRRLSRICW